MRSNFSSAPFPDRAARDAALIWSPFQWQPLEAYARQFPHVLTGPAPPPSNEQWLARRGLDQGALPSPV